MDKKNDSVEQPKYPVDILNQQYVKIECRPNNLKTRKTKEELMKETWHPFNYHIEMGEKPYYHYSSINGVMFTIMTGKNVWLPESIINDINDKISAAHNSGEDMMVQRLDESVRKEVFRR